MATRSPNLRRLDLSFVKLQSPTNEYKHILAGEAFGHLEELILNTVEVNDMSLLLAAEKVSNLKRIEFLRCKNITSAGLLGFGKSKGGHFSATVRDCLGIDQNYLKEMGGIVTVVAD